jgi:hypothetical protein
MYRQTLPLLFGFFWPVSLVWVSALTCAAASFFKIACRFFCVFVNVKKVFDTVKATWYFFIQLIGCPVNQKMNV